MPSISQEDYLREMYKLQEKKRECRITDLANALGISKPSVTEMMSRLVNEKLITQEKYSNPLLTKKGYAIGEKLTRKHRIIEYFLVEKLGLDKKEIDKTIERLYCYIGKPDKDPHGENIPK